MTDQDLRALARRTCALRIKDPGKVNKASFNSALDVLRLPVFDEPQERVEGKITIHEITHTVPHDTPGPALRP